MRMLAADSLIHERRLRLTREQFMQMTANDAFRDLRLELVKGQPVFMGTMDSPHARAIEALNEWLMPALVGRARLLVQLPLIIDDETLLVPDLAVVDRGASKDDHPSTALLVIEVSDSSARYDRIVKAPLYAQARIGTYWRVDLQKRHVEVFCEPVEGAYQQHRQVAHGMLAVPGFPDVELDVDALWR